MENTQTTEYAGFWLRFVALIIDSIIIQILQSFIVMPFMMMIGLSFLIPEAFDASSFENMSEDDIWIMIPAIISTITSAILISSILQILYYSLMESSKHQATLGKMALGLKVTDLNGERVDFLKAFLRQIGKYLSSMIMFIGYLMAGFTQKKQALHDILASTLVVKK